MRYYVLSYDLRGEVSAMDYTRLADLMRTAPDFCRALWSFWIVGTQLSPREIIETLLNHAVIDSSDGVVVLEITGKGDFFGAQPVEVAAWLRTRLTCV